MGLFKAVRMMLPSGEVIIATTKSMFDKLTKEGAKVIKRLKKADRPKDQKVDFGPGPFDDVKTSPLESGKIKPDKPDRLTSLGKRGYNIQVMKDGGLAKKKPKSKKSRGSGAAVKGTKFKGVF